MVLAKVDASGRGYDSVNDDGGPGLGTDSYGGSHGGYGGSNTAGELALCIIILSTCIFCNFFHVIKRKSICTNANITGALIIQDFTSNHDRFIFETH